MTRHLHDMLFSPGCCKHSAFRTSFPVAFCGPFVFLWTSLRLDKTKCRQQNANYLCSNPAAVYASASLPLITVPNERDLPTPGETCNVSLHHKVLQHMLTTRIRDFVVVGSYQLDAPDPRGAFLTLLNVQPPTEPTDKLSGECRCPSRVQLNDIVPPAVSSFSFTTTRITPVHDIIVESHTDRIALAEAEWEVWLNILETSRLSRRLASTQDFLLGTDDQHVRVWAPKHYDRLIKFDEWQETPFVTRQIWCRRAESFSFAVLRAMGASAEQLQEAMKTDRTLDRLALANNCIQTAQARIYAQLSLKDILG